MSKRVIKLLFKADVVVSVEPLSADAEKLADQLLKDITIAKQRIPCG